MEIYIVQHTGEHLNKMSGGMYIIRMLTRDEKDKPPITCNPSIKNICNIHLIVKLIKVINFRFHIST